MERTQGFFRVDVMRIIYISLIFISVVFNSFTQSYVYEACQAGIPINILIEANGDVDDALLLLSLDQLSEIRTS